MSQNYTIAIVGATGNVGKEIIKILKERAFPIKKLFSLDSNNLANFNFTNIDIAFFAAGQEVSKQYVPLATKAGCIVIDNSSYYRMDPKIPLVVPEVNPQALNNYQTHNIIANPNCSTIQMVTALKPLHDHFHINRIIVSTYQAMSGAGKKAMEELEKQTAFNVIPQIDVFLDDGATKEEWKMQVETQKILDAKIKIHANCARVPTFNGHAEYINIETEKPINLTSVKTILKKSPGIKLLDNPKKHQYATPVDVSGKDAVFVSRLRCDNSTTNGLSFWCVADNLRKGAALNAVQIAELLI